MLAISALTSLDSAKVDPPEPYGPIPSKAQLAYQEMEFIGFLHFTTNTFTDREWGHGDEDPNAFNPTSFDARKIVSVAKRAGMKQLILTCKHHDGFCLWPTNTTQHNVTKSPFKQDVVKLLSDECKKQRVKFGIYLSPWDRNNAYYGKPEYVHTYQEQLRELLSNYGQISEVWHDGANGGDGYYGGARETRKIDPGSYYRWDETWQMVRGLAPNAVIFSDAGPDVRWVGNESGYAGETCWATYTPHGPDSKTKPAPGQTNWKEGEQGHRNGEFWIPAECDVSIRPGWFWHESENDKVKTPQQLKDLYFKSVGRGATFLLNVPPDRRGQIHEADEKSLMEFRKLLDAAFAVDLANQATATADNVRGKDGRFAAKNLIDGKRNTYWCTDDGVKNGMVTLDFSKPIRFNTVRLREAIFLGQRIDKIAIETWQNDKWEELATTTSIGNCRLIQVQPRETTRVRIRIVEAATCPCLSELSLFFDPGGVQ